MIISIISFKHSPCGSSGLFDGLLDASRRELLDWLFEASGDGNSSSKLAAWTSTSTSTCLVSTVYDAHRKQENYIAAGTELTLDSNAAMGSSSYLKTFGVLVLVLCLPAIAALNLYFLCRYCWTHPPVIGRVLLQLWLQWQQPQRRPRQQLKRHTCK